MSNAGSKTAERFLQNAPRHSPEKKGDSLFSNFFLIFLKKRFLFFAKYVIMEESRSLRANPCTADFRTGGIEDAEKKRNTPWTDAAAGSVLCADSAGSGRMRFRCAGENGVRQHRRDNSRRGQQAVRHQENHNRYCHGIQKDKHHAKDCRSCVRQPVGNEAGEEQQPE